MAVLLMAGVAVFSVPTPEFGPAILAAPLWALLLYHYWRAAKEATGGSGSRPASMRACCCSRPMRA